jgi:hypothetical protein
VGDRGVGADECEERGDHARLFLWWRLLLLWLWFGGWLLVVVGATFARADRARSDELGVVIFGI